MRVWGAQADITERRRAEEALRASEQLLSSINQNISEGIYRYTPQGTLLYANDALARLFGYASGEEMRHAPVSTWYRHPARCDELAARAARDHGLSNEEAEFVRKDGSTFWGRITCNATFDAEGRIVTFDGAISDVSQRKRYEQSLIEAKEQALEIAQLKSAFLANMSHEIRTPLTAVVGFADILAEEITGEHQEMAQLIQQSGQRLVQTLQSVLDLARLEREAYVGEKLHLSTAPIEVVTVIRQVLDLFSLQAEQRGLDLQLNAPDEPVTARLDAGALSRILTNLISNAMKFTPNGYIRVTLTYRNDDLTLQVKDSGIGISKDFLPQLFSEFRREAKTLPLGKEGNGLGLAITKRLVALLSGTIEVESKKNRGSLFTVRLPRNLHQDSP